MLEPSRLSARAYAGSRAEKCIATRRLNGCVLGHDEETIDPGWLLRTATLVSG